MASAVPVPRSANSGGTRTNSDDAGVTQLSVSRVPPPTPIERVRVFFASAGAATSGGAGVRGMGVPSGRGKVRRMEQHRFGVVNATKTTEIVVWPRKGLRI